LANGEREGSVTPPLQGQASFDAPRETAPPRAPETARESVAQASTPSSAAGFAAPRPPEPRSFDFGRPAAPPAAFVPASEAGPAPVAREPAQVATAAEPRGWTPTPPTDVATPRDEP
jgi:hypothetical protein